VGVFLWSGEYVVPEYENKYEIFLGSSKRGDLVVADKTRYDEHRITFGGRSTVMVIRPPLPKKQNPNFGLVLGIVIPTTSQVQFTFSEAETHELCAWAADQASKGRIRKDFARYDITREERLPCN
jgi:hypothetical protein